MNGKKYHSYTVKNKNIMLIIKNTRPSDKYSTVAYVDVEAVEYLYRKDVDSSPTGELMFLGQFSIIELRLVKPLD